MEKKSIPLELKDMSKEKRTAVIAHAVYNVIDKTGDISTKGMFNKSWKEKKNIDFLFNHDEEAVVGSVKRVFEDNDRAYTEVKFGNWTLGDDVLEMADSGVLKGASFGYVTEKKEYVEINGRMVRKLKEVWHNETSLLTKMPANPLAGIVELNKSIDKLDMKMLSQEEQGVLKRILLSDHDALVQLVLLSEKLEPASDLYTWIMYSISNRSGLISELRSQLKYNTEEAKQLKEYIQKMERFCMDGKASDECIKSVQQDIKEAKRLLREYDTVLTHYEQSASVFAEELYFLTLKF